MLEKTLEALQLRDWYALSAVALYVAIAVWKRAGGKLANRIPDPWRWLPPVLISAATGFVASWQSGASWQASALGAVGAIATMAIPAMGLQSWVKQGEVLKLLAALPRLLAAFKKSAPPAALLLCGALAVGGGQGCASVKPILKGIDSAATLLCLGAASKAPKEQLAGLSAKEWCAVKRNLQPFIDAALAAQRAGAEQTGLAPADE